MLATHEPVIGLFTGTGSLPQGPGGVREARVPVAGDDVVLVRKLEAEIGRTWQSRFARVGVE